MNNLTELNTILLTAGTEARNSAEVLDKLSAIVVITLAIILGVVYMYKVTSEDKKTTSTPQPTLPVKQVKEAKQVELEVEHTKPKQPAKKKVNQPESKSK